MKSHLSPLHPIICLTLSHQQAPIALLERLRFTAESLPAALAHFRQHPLWSTGEMTEIAIISTCNRTEFYIAGTLTQTQTSANQAAKAILQTWAEMHELPASQLTPHIQIRHGDAASRYLCRVAAGLDSIVLGEPQILGQVISAQKVAQKQKTIGTILSALFNTAIRAGKRARTETHISRRSASLGSVAVQLAQRVVPDFSCSHVAVIGTGEMGQLALKALQQRGVGNVSIVNRTYQRAAEMAAHWGGEAYAFDQLPMIMQKSDIVITATGAKQAIISRAMLQDVMTFRANRPLVLIDIAVPRDVESEAGTLPHVHLFDMDGIKQQLADSLNERQQEIPLVEAIITEEIHKLESKLRELSVRPVIVDLRQKANSIRQQELDRTRRYLSHLEPSEWKHVEHLARSLVNKLLHDPTIRLKDEAINGQPDPHINTLRYLFALE